MAKILSQSQQSEHKTKNFFVPSGAEIFLYALLSLVLIIVFNSSALLKTFNNNVGTPERLKLNITILNSSLSNSFGNVLGGRLGLIIFWSFIGAIAYVALWFCKNLLNSFENDVIIDHYLHPAGYNRTGYWGSALAGKIFFAVMVILLITFGFISLKLILPAVSALAGSAVYHFNFPQSIYYMALSLGIVMFSMYLLVRIVRITSHLWKLL